MRHATWAVPFSALGPAVRSSGEVNFLTDAIIAGEVQLIDKSERREDVIGYAELAPDVSKEIYHQGWRGNWKQLKRPSHRITEAQYKKLSYPEQTRFVEVLESRPEYVLLKIKETYLIGGMDNNNYFISQLSAPADSVDNALDQLKPPQIRGLSPQGYIRQGEWFFIPYTVPASLLWGEGDNKRVYRYLKRDFILPKRTPGGNDHTATRGGIVDDVVIVTGQVRHPDHRMLRLSKADNPLIYAAYRNTEVNSWSAGGRVD